MINNVLIEITSDFKKQLLLTRLHGVQATNADDRDLEVRQGRGQRFLARGVTRSGLRED